MNVAWCVTGAGHFLKESVEAFKHLREQGVKITTLVSKAAEEVLKMYGLSPQLKRISSGGYLEEIFLESEQGASFPKAGRFLLRKYAALVVSPATANTVAKIANGIADSLVTNAVSLAMKGGIPVFVVPTDFIFGSKDGTGVLRSKMPYIVNREVCQAWKCEHCSPREVCPQNAISEQIDLLRCDGCGRCVSACPHGAIRGGEDVEIRVRKVDAKNVLTLVTMGVHVLRSPGEISRALSHLERIY
ncbi:dihydromethanopterin reductase (acceptor) [Candidatus Alkanophaga liquidiphilum]